MKAQRLLEVQPLPWRVARTLFRELVGKDTLISTPEIFELAQSTVERCQGFPSAIITTGQTLAACKNFKEWEQLTQELGDLIEEEISEKVRENTLNSHPDIPHLSEKVALCYKGLPLALVTVGRALADKNSPEA
ncbi:putative disease resistance protein [Vitis vinifera]|uniref:Putative disease resistance protein n=1 Tax=Vitis vinifera TaxID=29760 RepID=A0A438G383_VITVI|nr:putative disease resistance protein [Vitis vinifera]